MSNLKQLANSLENEILAIETRQRAVLNMMMQCVEWDENGMAYFYPFDEEDDVIDTCLCDDCIDGTDGVFYPLAINKNYELYGYLDGHCPMEVTRNMFTDGDEYLVIDKFWDNGKNLGTIIKLLSNIIEEDDVTETADNVCAIVCDVSTDDLINGGYDVTDVDREKLRAIANHMADYILNETYWFALEDACSRLNIPKKTED